jgi:hypothetical protein
MMDAQEYNSRTYLKIGYGKKQRATLAAVTSR